jgi:hypothetical protein
VALTTPAERADPGPAAIVCPTEITAASAKIATPPRHSVDRPINLESALFIALLLGATLPRTDRQG